jgi:bacterioferritin
MGEEVKRHPEVIQSLQERLSEELAAILQHMVHAEMAENWGFKALANHLKAHAITEIRHAEKHIERILFLEGFPEVSRIGDQDREERAGDPLQGLRGGTAGGEGLQRDHEPGPEPRGQRHPG